jgi:hypothetical protein
MFAQSYVNNFKSFAILVFYISLIEVITPHERVAPSGTRAERSESLYIGIASGLHPSQ